MADQVSTKLTSLPPDEVIVRAVQFFSTERWEATSQSARAVTFRGKPPIPWFLIIFTILGFALCVVPGLIMYFILVRSRYKFFNLVVTVTGTDKGTKVTMTHPGFAFGLVKRFADALPSPA